MGDPQRARKGSPLVRQIEAGQSGVQPGPSARQPAAHIGDEHRNIVVRRVIPRECDHPQQC